MSNKLPKHIAQMVEKNNLVMAIKTLADEKDISMGDAKTIIDEYEEKLKNKQIQKTEAITAKQDKRKPNKIDSNHQINQDPINIQSNPKMDELNVGLDQHLHKIGYKKPLLPHWVKRVFIILIIVALLSLLFWQLLLPLN